MLYNNMVFFKSTLYLSTFEFSNLFGVKLFRWIFYNGNTDSSATIFQITGIYQYMRYDTLSFL